jgi:hypothetical protein
MHIKNLCCLLVGGLLLLGGCKKSASAGAAITTTINGVAETFNTSAFAEISNNAWASTLIIGGYQNNTAQPDILSIQVSGQGYITTGTYTFSKANFNNPQPSILYYQNRNAYTQDTSSANTITITALTSTNVQGTFSGALLLDSGSASPVKKIAISGSFNVPVRKP